MKRLIGFLRQYKTFSMALVTIVIGLVLEFKKQYTALDWLLAVVSVLGLLPLFTKMWQDIKIGRYGINVLAVTAIVTSVILSEYWTAIVILAITAGSGAVENFARHRSKAELDTLLRNKPKKAQLLRKGKIVEVSIDQIHIGDKILVNKDGVVPVDSIVIDGSAGFDESPLTGQDIPQIKRDGDTLLSGSINMDGAVTAKALSTADDSYYQQTIKLLRASLDSQTPFAKLADRYSIPFTILAYSIAVGAWVGTGESARFLEVVVVATPYALLVAAPIAITSGISRASRYGIVAKTGSALERLAGAKTIAFGKTGILTTGNLKVTSINSFAPHKKSEILSLAASLEQNSDHAVAAAIVEAAATQKVKYQKAKHAKEIVGRGLIAQLKGKHVILGNSGLMEEHAIKIPAASESKVSKLTTVYIAIDGQLAGSIALTDEVRTSSRATINSLNKLGVGDVIMVTGDSSKAAKTTNKNLGLSSVFSGALPADKLKVIEQHSQRPVAFVGDGINDAPVLTAADIGLALDSKGSKAASEPADIVIVSNDISRVAAAFEIAKRTFRIARQSIIIGTGFSIALMLIFSTGRFSPLAGALLQILVNLTVIFSALRAHSLRPSTIH